MHEMMDVVTCASSRKDISKDKHPYMIHIHVLTACVTSYVMSMIYTVVVYNQNEMGSCATQPRESVNVAALELPVSEMSAEGHWHP